MINIKTIVVPKRDSASNGNGTTIISNTTNNHTGQKFEPHYLWGQYFDDTNDIDGDLVSKGNITGNNLYATNNINATKVSGENGEFIHVDSESASISNITTDHILATDLDAENGNITKLVSDVIKANTVTSKVGNIDSIYSATVDTQNLRAVEAYIKTLLSENITTDYLTVTKAAHFFKLIIDEIKSVGGNIIVTPANMDVDSVVKLANGDYRCYAKSTDDGVEITNTWEVGDQAVCQTFNVHEGVNENVGNKWYWRYVTNTGSIRSVAFNNNSIKNLAVANFDADGDGEVTFDEIKAVTNIGTIFNTASGNFDSFKYFKGVTSLSQSAFEGSKITKVTTPTSLKTIGRYGFRYLSTLQEVNLNEGLTTIYDAAFRQCSNVTSLVIPSTVTNIYSYALSRMYNCRYIRFKRSTPPALRTYVFTDTPAIFYVPANAVDTYKAAWPDYADRIEADPYEDSIIDYTELEDARIYIDLSDTDKDSGSNAVPEAGDKLVLLGNRTDTSRQNAIIISAYDIDWLDKGDDNHAKIHAPLIAQYKGINTYNLTPYRWSIISRDLNMFRGDFALNSGKSVEDAINEYTNTYVHIAYANSADGSQDFTKTNVTNNYNYIGFCSNFNETDTGLTYKDYKWSRYKGENAFKYRIVNNGSYANIVVQYDSNNHVELDSNGVPIRNINVYINVYLMYNNGDEVKILNTQELVTQHGLSVYYSLGSVYYPVSINERGYFIKSLTSSYDISKAELKIAIQKDGTFIDYLSIPIVMSSQATLDVVNDGDARITATLSGYVTEESYNGDYQSIVNKYTTLNATVDNINTTVESHTTSIDRISGKFNDYYTKSQIDQTASSIKSEVKNYTDDAIGNIDRTYVKMTTIDATSLDQTKCYPVVIDFKGYNGSERINCCVKRTLKNTYGTPIYDDNRYLEDGVTENPNYNPYGYAAHAEGLSVILQWSTIASGWGTNADSSIEHWSEGDKYRIIDTYKLNWNVGYYPMNVVGSIGQIWQASIEVVYVRGGSKYDIYSSYRDTTIELKSDGYTWSRTGDNGNVVTNTRNIINVEDLVVPVQDAMSRSEIVQTAENIQLNVYNELKEKTGIDISSGQIVLDADNTIINGSLKINNANDGVVIYNDSGEKAVEIVKESIGSFGSSQNDTTTQKVSTTTYTYIIGTNNSYRQYLDTYDTTAGYVRESSYSWETSHNCSRISFGNLKEGTKITVNANDLQWETKGYGGTYNSYTGIYEYNNVNVVDNTQQIKISVRNVYGSNKIPYESEWLSVSRSGNTYKYASAFTYTIDVDGTYELYIDFKGTNPTFTGTTTKCKILSFVGTCKFTTTKSINTKIGTDGFRSMTNNGEVWFGDEQNTLAYKNKGTTVYGSNYKAFGLRVDQHGVTKCLGNSISNMQNYDNVATVVNISSVYNGYDAKTGTSGWNFSASIDGAWRSYYVLNHTNGGLFARYFVCWSLDTSYQNVDGYFGLQYNLSDRLPIGTQVTVINHTGRPMQIVQSSSLPSNLYDYDSTSTTTKIGIGNGRLAEFIHIGNGYWKCLYRN